MRKLKNIIEIPWHADVSKCIFAKKTNQMKLSDFNYDLPKNLLAEFPSENRDESRLMVIDRKTEKIEHYHDKSGINLLGPIISFK